MLTQLNKIEIRKSAEELLSNSNLPDEIPIDVELIAERTCNLQLQPVRGLSWGCDTEGMLLSDLTTILFSEDNSDVRIRFTIAHELGHFILHKDYIQNLGFTSLTEWLDFLKSFPPADWAQAEWEANMFAGYLLVPEELLYKMITASKELLQPLKQKKIREEVLRGYLANHFAPKFNVSTATMEIRFKNMEKAIYDLI